MDVHRTEDPQSMVKIPNGTLKIPRDIFQKSQYVKNLHGKADDPSGHHNIQQYLKTKGTAPDLENSV